MSLASRLYRGEVSYDFIGHRERWYAISAVVIVVCIASMIFRGFTFGIDFKGGAEFDFPSNGHTVTDARSALDGTGVNVEVVQSLSSSPPTIRIQTKPITGGADREGHRGHPAEVRHRERQLDDVSARRGGRRSPRRRSQGLIVFLVLVMIYISFRFEPKMAAAAIVALIHDLLITAGIYSTRGLRGNPGHGHRHADDPRFLALRHRRRLRQGPRKHGRDSRSPAARPTPRRPTTRSTRP